MHRILNCPNYCITSLFIIWQQCDPGLKDLLVKKIMCFPFSVLLKCQVLRFWHLLKNKMSSEIFSLSTEVTSEELGEAGLFSTFSFAQKFRHISFPQKLPIFASLCVLAAKKKKKKLSFISLSCFTDNLFLSLPASPSQALKVCASEQGWAALGCIPATPVTAALSRQTAAAPSLPCQRPRGSATLVTPVSQENRHSSGQN